MTALVESADGTFVSTIISVVVVVVGWLSDSATIGLESSLSSKKDLDPILTFLLAICHT